MLLTIYVWIPYKYAPFSYSYRISSSVFSNFPYHLFLFFNFFPFCMLRVFILISDILYEYAWWYAFGIFQMSIEYSKWVWKVSDEITLSWYVLYALKIFYMSLEYYKEYEMWVMKSYSFGIFCTDIYL
jgi:hypothetical protein